MCGLAIVFQSRPHSAEPFVRSMLGRMYHRGFSHNEIWASSMVALGANRLEIVDPLGGKQPATNENSTLFAVLNGEIYNHQELRNHLKSCGHSFKSVCDTEILVHAFEEWGTDLCKELRGMFAFAIYNQKDNSILLARDPTGIKPLYIGYGHNTLFAASEAKALVGFTDSADLLPPGHVFVGSNSIPYHSVNEETIGYSFEVAASHLRELLIESLHLRIQKDLPFAIFLSSGIDSSFLLALAAKIRPDVIAISFGLPGSPELVEAAKFCQLLGVRHEAVEMSFDELILRYEKVIYHLESFEPNLVRAALITDALCERARQLGLRVALAGEGADEQFAGYDDFQLLPENELEGALQTFFNDLHRTQLLRWDKIGMAHTLEVRAPFMDSRIVAFAHSLPASCKIGFLPDKAEKFCKTILREAAKGILPETIRLRQKLPMDDGVVAGGGQKWSLLVSKYIESLPIPTLPSSICEQYAIQSREECVNLNILLRYLPPEFISDSRITVRKKPT